MVQSKKGLISGSALSYPKAVRIHKPDVLKRQPFKEILGITVHYSASGSLEGTLRSMEADRIGYHVVIGKDGSCIQSCLFSHCVAHAGVASWHGVSPNRNHLAVSFVGWGLLDKEGKSYVGTQIAPENIRTDKKGHKWEKATSAQELALVDFLTWACREFRIDPEQICGHDEAAPTRKVDPGNSLSMTMASLRALIHAKLA